MSEDLNKKIKQITDILGQDNMPENIKGLLTLLAGSQTGPGSDPPPNSGSSGELTQEKPVRSELEDNIDMLRKAKSIMDRLNNDNDPRINLLIAIKPFLSNRRQKKLSGCLNMLRMSNLARFMDDNEKGALE